MQQKIKYKMTVSIREIYKMRLYTLVYIEPMHCADVLFFFLFFPLALQLYFNLGSIINNVCWFAPANTYYDNIVYIGTAQHYHTLINGYYYLIYLILYNNEYDITLRLDYNQKTNIPYDIKQLISNCQNPP